MNLESFEAELRLNLFDDIADAFWPQTQLAQRFLEIQKGKGSANVQIDHKCDPLFHHHFVVANVHERWTRKSRTQRSTIVLQFWTELAAKALTHDSFVREFKESKNCVHSLRTHIDCCCKKMNFFPTQTTLGSCVSGAFGQQEQLL